jgi:hypothetical protein
MIDFLGGQCCLCEFSLYPSALHIHHFDPAIKDPRLKKDGDAWLSWRWERVEVELRKCVLLCANCHAGVTWDGAIVPPNKMPPHLLYSNLIPGTLPTHK